MINDIKGISSVDSTMISGRRTDAAAVAAVANLELLCYLMSSSSKRV
jgi:hypothetical protein